MRAAGGTLVKEYQLMTMNDSLFPEPQDPLPPNAAAAAANVAGAAALNHLHDADLRGLIEEGRRTGYLTFDQINAYLPDEAVDPEKIDALLVALDDKGIELVEEL